VPAVRYDAPPSLEEALADLAELIIAARSWAATDPDPDSRAELLARIDAKDERWLSEGFGDRLAFGTAGLRGALGPGPNRMNRALVRRVAAALGDYLLANVPGATSRGVVIGFDARRLSREFAADTAALLADRGIVAWLYRDYVPTPRLAHAVVRLGACAGVMVTASHNPPGDNGYKVYWGNGAQIVPPHDGGISAAIDALVGFDPREIGDLGAHRAAGLVREPDPSVAADYFARVQALRVHPTRPIRIVYTNMHGVGGESVRRVLAEAGYDDLHDVAEQSAPDGLFPTVAFPNPEEPGALDLALALAQRVGADVIIANDPDGDRLAVAVPDGAGRYRPLTGNEVGVLLGHDLLVNGEHGGRTPLLATTIVSSRMLSRIAAAHGAAYAETLTGFKWIANAAIAHDAAGGRFVLGYEEALGYSAGDVARDKDGVSAALLLVDLAAACKARGQTLLDHLADLFRAYGLHASLQRSVTLPGLQGRARITSAMERLRAEPPTDLEGVPVIRFVDVERGEQLDLATGARAPLDLPRSDVLVWELGDGSRVLARPSGTEPKIKFYAEVRDVLAASEPLAAAEARARARLAPLVQSLLVRAHLA
jgi:phosphomannomutase